MNWYLAFGFINVIICLADIYKQGFCKAIDLISTLVMFISGPFGTSLIVLHYNADKVNNILERVVWRKKPNYVEFLEREKRKNG